MKRLLIYTIFIIFLILGVIFSTIMYKNSYKENLAQNDKMKDFNINQVNNEIMKEAVSNNLKTVDEKYIVKENEGIVVVYLESNNIRKIVQSTQIAVEYLTERDKEELKEGIIARNMEEVNAILENYE